MSYGTNSSVSVDLGTKRPKQNSGGGGGGGGHGHSHGGSGHSHSHGHGHGGGGGGDDGTADTDALIDPRSAYQAGDAEASRAAHARKAQAAEGDVEMAPEQHGSGGGGHLKSIVYGGLDGIITTFATVTSVAGAELSASIILILGIAHLFADGLSMGMGDALSEEAEREFYRAEKRREKWEMDQYMEGEMAEMIQEYMQKGVSKDDARTILTTMAKYPDVFLDHMMFMELNMLPVDESESPVKAGLVTFASFVLFGCVPLLSYLISLFGIVPMSDTTQFYAACGLTLFTLFLLGAIKGLMVDRDKGRWWRSALTMLGYGSLAAGVAYFMGWFLKHYVGADM